MSILKCAGIRRHEDIMTSTKHQGIKTSRHHRHQHIILSITTSPRSESLKMETKSKDMWPSISLVENGPRFISTPIIILEDSFGGLYSMRTRNTCVRTRRNATSDYKRRAAPPFRQFLAKPGPDHAYALREKRWYCRNANLRIQKEGVVAIFLHIDFILLRVTSGGGAQSGQQGGTVARNPKILSAYLQSDHLILKLSNNFLE